MYAELNHSVGDAHWSRNFPSAFTPGCGWKIVNYSRPHDAWQLLRADCGTGECRSEADIDTNRRRCGNASPMRMRDSV